MTWELQQWKDYELLHQQGWTSVSQWFLPRAPMLLFIFSNNSFCAKIQTCMNCWTGLRRCWGLRISVLGKMPCLFIEAYTNQVARLETADSSTLPIAESGRGTPSFFCPFPLRSFICYLSLPVVKSRHRGMLHSGQDEGGGLQIHGGNGQKSCGYQLSTCTLRLLFLQYNVPISARDWKVQLKYLVAS